MNISQGEMPPESQSSTSTPAKKSFLKLDDVATLYIPAARYQLSGCEIPEQYLDTGSGLSEFMHCLITAFFIRDHADSLSPQSNAAEAEVIIRKDDTETYVNLLGFSFDLTESLSSRQSLTARDRVYESDYWRETFRRLPFLNDTGEQISDKDQGLDPTSYTVELGGWVKFINDFLTDWYANQDNPAQGVKLSPEEFCELLEQMNHHWQQPTTPRILEDDALPDFISQFIGRCYPTPQQQQEADDFSDELSELIMLEDDDEDLDDTHLTDPLNIMSSCMREWLTQLCYVKVAQLTQGAANSNINVQQGKFPSAYNVTALDMLSALLATPELLQAVAKKSKQTMTSLRFPEIVYQQRAAMAEVIPTRTFETDGGHSIDWFQRVRQQLSRVTQGVEVQTLLWGEGLDVSSSAEAFADWLWDNAKRELGRQPDALFYDFRELNEHVQIKDVWHTTQAIEQYLKGKVKGQHAALRDVLQSHLYSTFTPVEGLRSLLTFVGPSGVGKTLLAQAYSQALSRHEGTGYACRVFNMEAFSDQKAAGNLFGAGSQYHDSGLGQLTLQVMTQPRSVLIFDEIEKAHANVIQALLTLLDTGKAMDSTTCQLVDFSQCVVIFTSNLGVNEFKHAARLGEVDIFGILTGASRRNEHAPTLAPELVNRLKRGQGVLLQPLNVPALLAIAAQEAKQLAEHTQGLFQYKFDPDFAAVLVFAQLPEPSVRGVHSIATDIMAEAQRQLLLNPSYRDHLDHLQHLQVNIADDCLATPISQFRIGVLGDLLAAEISARNANTPAGILSYVPQNCAHLKHSQPDALLIDGRGWSQQELESEIQRVQAALPQALSYGAQFPLFLLLDDASLAAECDALWAVWTASQWDEMTASMARLLQIHWRVKDATRRQLVFRYQLKISMRNKNTAQVLVHQPEFKRAVSAQRIKQGIPGLIEQRPKVALKEVIGLQRAKAKLARVIEWMRQIDRLPSHTGMPSGILLAGPPGTGKTMLAQAVAAECDLPFINLKVGELVSSLANGTAVNLQKAFTAAAEIAPCIVFIDEIDAIASRRNGQSHNSDRAAVNTLLTELDGLQERADPILVIAASNAPQLLDPALLRAGRLDEQVHCDLPNRQARRQFLTHFMHKYIAAEPTTAVESTIDDEEMELWIDLSRNMSGADLQQALKEYLFQISLRSPASDSAESSNALTLDTELLRDALANVRYGKANGGDMLTARARRLVAYHEAGHLLASKMLMPQQRVTFVTIEPRNQVLGFVASHRDEAQGPHTMSEIKAQLAVLMAGREAERLISEAHEISIGASGDIAQATQLAESAVCELGLDDEFGQLATARLNRGQLSPDLQAQAEARIRFWLEEARVQAAALLGENQQILKHIAERLFKEESLYGDEIDQLL